MIHQICQTSPRIILLCYGTWYNMYVASMHNSELYSNVASYVHNYPSYLLEVTMKFFMRILCSALASGVYYLTIAKYL